MLGQKDKLLLGLKQFALLGAVLGLIFGSGAFSYTEVFADEDSDWEKRIRASLPSSEHDLVFRVDMATQDPRPENPFAMGKKQIHIFDPSTGEITKGSLSELFEFIPSKVVQFRVFALDHESDHLLAEVAERTLKGGSPAVKTSV